MGRKVQMKAEVEIPKVLCTKTGCKRIAVNVIQAEFRQHPNTIPAMTTHLMYACMEHSHVQFNDFFLNKKEWDKVQRTFIVSRYQPPKKRWSNLVIKPL